MAEENFMNDTNYFIQEERKAEFLTDGRRHIIMRGRRYTAPPLTSAGSVSMPASCKVSITDKSEE